jgi:hypothetical protein
MGLADIVKRELSTQWGGWELEANVRIIETTSLVVVLLYPRGQEWNSGVGTLFTPELFDSRDNTEWVVELLLGEWDGNTSGVP